MRKVRLAIVISSLFLTAGADFACAYESMNVDHDQTLMAPENTVNWFETTNDKKNITIIGSDTSDKAFSVTLNNKNSGTDSFLKADGKDAQIHVSNLKEFNFLTEKEFDYNGKNGNHNPLITANGGTLTFDNIEHIQFGTEKSPLQVDQISHQNWNGGDITFKNIGTLDAYSKKTGFLIQSQSGAFPALRFENIDNVNINANGTYGIHIAASSENTNLDTTYTVLDVKSVGSFNVGGNTSGIYISDVNGTYHGKGKMFGSIQADTVNIYKGSTGLEISLNQNKSKESSIDFEISATKKITLSGALYGLKALNTNNTADNMQIKLAAPEIKIEQTWDVSGANAVYMDTSRVEITADKLTIDGGMDLDGTADLTVAGRSATAVVDVTGNWAADAGTSVNLKNANLNFGGKELKSNGSLTLKDSAMSLSGESIAEITKLSSSNAVLSLDGSSSAKVGSLSASSSIDMAIKGESTMQIDELSGAKATTVLYRLAKSANDPKPLTVKQNAVQGYEIALASELNDAFTGDVQAAAQALEDSIDVTDKQGSNGTHTIRGLSGKLSDGWTAKVGNDGKVVITETAFNQALDALENFKAMTFVQWRTEGSRINQRLGDVRDSSTKVGARGDERRAA